MFATEDREYLRGEKQYATEQGEYDRRSTIRQRLFDGIVDFKEAQRRLSDWNWQKFIEQDRDGYDELRTGMIAAVSLFYEYHRALDLDFEETIRRAVEEAHEGSGVSRGVPKQVVDNVELDIDTSSPAGVGEIHNRISRKLKNDEPLTDREIRLGISADVETRNRVIEHTLERRDNPSEKYKNWARHAEDRFDDSQSEEESS